MSQPWCLQERQSQASCGASLLASKSIRVPLGSQLLCPGQSHEPGLMQPSLVPPPQAHRAFQHKRGFPKSTLPSQTWLQTEVEAFQFHF